MFVGGPSTLLVRSQQTRKVHGVGRRRAAATASGARSAAFQVVGALLSLLPVGVASG